MANKKHRLKTNKLSKEFNRVITIALKPDAIMQLKSSEVKNFFGIKSECKICKIHYYNSTNFKYIKPIISKKIRGKMKVLAVMRGNKKTTLDHLNSIWNVILKNTKNTFWAYYQSNRKDNSLYLLTY